MKSSKKVSKLFDSKAFRVIISVLAALLIWMYYTSTQEDEIERDFSDVPVVFSGAETMQESKGFVVTNVDTVSVSVRITGSRENIGKLVDSDLQAVIDLSKVTKDGNYRFSYEIVYPESVDDTAVTVVSKTPEVIEFYVAELSTKTVPIKGTFMGSTAEGYVAEALEFEPETITLSGPDSELNNIEYVWVTLDGDELTDSKTADVNFTYMDKSGDQLDYTDITSDFDTVSVTLPVMLKKEVALSVTPVYGAGATEENTIITIEPETITVYGDPETVEGMNKIPLATIDMTDFSPIFEYTYTISLPNDVQNLTGLTKATVKVEVVGLETKKLDCTNFSFINLPDGYSADILTESKEITIRAAEDVLKEITADNLRAVADLTDISSTGDVSVPVKIYIDGFSDAGAIGDYTITVNIKE